MNVKKILIDNERTVRMPFGAMVDEIVDALQEYVDETEHQGDPMPPVDAIPWMYDFALYRKITDTI